MADDRHLARVRLDLLVSDIRNHRAAGRRFEADELAEAIRQLPARQASVAQLVYLEGLSVLAAARRLGIHHSTAQEALRAGAINLGAALTLPGGT